MEAEVFYLLKSSSSQQYSSIVWRYEYEAEVESNPKETD